MLRIIGLTKRNSTAVYLSEKSVNPHLVCIGKSGSGKSVFMHSQVIQLADAGEKVIIINWKRCLDHRMIHPALIARYEKNTTIIDALRDGISLPLFSSYDGTELSLRRCAQSIAKMLTIAVKLSPTQENITYEALCDIGKKGLYQEEGIQVLGEWLRQQECAVASNAVAKLRTIIAENIFVQGDIFADETKNIIEIDLNKLEYDQQEAVCRFLLDYILRLAQKGRFLDRPVSVFIDEAQNLDFSERSAVGMMLNESRKLNVSLLLALPYLYSENRKDLGLLAQAATQIFFTPLERERKAIAHFIDERDMHAWLFSLSRLQRGEFIAKGEFDFDGKARDEICGLKTYFFDEERGRV